MINVGCVNREKINGLTQCQKLQKNFPIFVGNDKSVKKQNKSSQISSSETFRVF